MESTVVNNLRYFVQLGGLFLTEFCTWDDKRKIFVANTTLRSKLLLFLQMVLFCVFIYSINADILSFNLEFIVAKTELFFVVLYTNGLWLISYLCQKPLVKTCTSIKKIEIFMEKFFNGPTKYRLPILAYLSTALFNTLLTVISFGFFSSYYSIQKVSLHKIVPSLLWYYKNGLYSLLLHALNGIYGTLNERLLGIAEMKNRNCLMCCCQRLNDIHKVNFVRNVPNINNLCQVHAIQCFRIIYGELWKSCKYWNEAFQYTQFLTMLFAYAEILLQIMLSYHTFSHGQFGEAFIVNLINVSRIIFFTCLFIYRCESCYTLHQKSAQILHRMFMRTANKKLIREEVLSFSVELEQRPLKFTICGFYSFDGEYLVEIAKSLITMSVIAIQMNIEIFKYY